MSGKAKRGLYDPLRHGSGRAGGEPYKLSRSKIELFLQSPRMFYLDRRLGIKVPSGPAFTLNSAVDELLKREFDILRKKGHAHDIMKQYKIDAVPFAHPELDVWRQNFTGKQYLHEQTNLLIFGAVDDLWVNPKGEIIIVDYKSTSTSKEISLDDQWKQVFKRQMDIYAWIFQKSGFKLNDTGYFVYANAEKDRPRFDARLEFALTLHPYKHDSSWVESVIFDIKTALDGNKIPPSDESEYSQFLDEAVRVLGE